MTTLRDIERKIKKNRALLKVLLRSAEDLLVDLDLLSAEERSVEAVAEHTFVFQGSPELILNEIARSTYPRSPIDLARSLDLPATRVRVAVFRLKRAGLIEKEGNGYRLSQQR